MIAFANMPFVDTTQGMQAFNDIRQEAWSQRNLKDNMFGELVKIQNVQNESGLSKSDKGGIQNNFNCFVEILKSKVPQHMVGILDSKSQISRILLGVIYKIQNSQNCQSLFGFPQGRVNI